MNNYEWLTVGRVNLYRYWIRVATLEAVEQRREFSPANRKKHAVITDIKAQVARAMFCAKLDGDEFSKLRR